MISDKLPTFNDLGYNIQCSCIMPKDEEKKSDSIGFTLYGLNFLIVNKINDLIKGAIEDVKEHLDRPVTKNKLSSLHLAVISGNIEAVRQLLKRKIDINPLDARKWTPLHHAALINDKVILELLKKSADLHATTDTGMTYADIIRLTTRPSFESNSFIPLFREKNKNEFEKLTQGAFKELTKAKYITDYFVSKKRMVIDWNKPKCTQEYFSFSGKLKINLNEFLKTSPSFLLKNVIQDSNGKALSTSPGLGLFAMKDYEKEDSIGEYKGKLVKDAKQGKVYFLGGNNIEAQDFRNEMPFVNDAFPNITLVPIEDCGYPEKRSAFFCIEPIKKHQEFYWNYGFQNTKLGPYEELRPRELREFVKQNDLDKILQLLIVSGINGNISFDEFTQSEKLRYILCTPTALFSMTLDKTLDEKKSQQLLEWAYQFFHIPEKAPFILKNLSCIASQSVKMQEEMGEFSSQASVSYFQFIHSLPARIGIVSALRYILEVNNHLSKTIKELKNTLEKDWNIENPNFVLELDQEFLKMWLGIKKKIELRIGE